MPKRANELKIKVSLEGVEILPPGYGVIASAKQADGSVVYTIETPGADDDQAILDAMFGDRPDYQRVDAGTIC